MKLEQGLTGQVPRAPPHRLFVSPSPVVDVPHCRESQILSDLHTEGSLGQHQAEPSLRRGVWDIP